MKRLNALIMVFFFASFDSHAQSARSRFFKDKTQIENVTELRDPFSSTITRAGQTKADIKKDKEIKTSFSNINEPKLDSLDSMRIVGVVLGKEKRAIAQTQDGIMTLKEGAVFGSNDIELKAVLPGGVVFVEKILNIYGEEEYLETVIPITQE